MPTSSPQRPVQLSRQIPNTIIHSNCRNAYAPSEKNIQNNQPAVPSSSRIKISKYFRENLPLKISCFRLFKSCYLDISS